MGGRVAVLSPEGQFGTVDEADVPNLPSGARVLTKQEIAAQQTEAAYEAQPTWKKVATVATMAGPVGYIPHALLRASGALAPPSLEAYTQGVSEGMSGGLASVGMKELVGAVGGHEAAKAYGHTAEQVKEGHAGLYNAGQLAGFIGGAEASPFSKVGAAVEGATAAKLGGLAARGALGRAGATALELGARGAVEGALYGAAQQVSDDVLGDRDLAADKIFAAAGLGGLAGFAGGAVIGGAGSLAKSGAQAAVGGIRSSLARAAGRAEQAATEATAKGEAAAADAKQMLRDKAAQATAEATTDIANAAKSAAEATGTKPAQEVGAARGLLSEMASTEGQKGVAYDQAWKALNSGGLSPTKYVKKADRFLGGGTSGQGTRAIGETLMRRGVINADDGVIAAARNGTPGAMLPKIEEELAISGSNLGKMTETSGATVSAAEVHGLVDDVLAPLKKKAGFEAIAKNVENYGDSLLEKLGVKMPTGLEEYPPEVQKAVLDKMLANHQIPIQSLLEQRKALDELVWREGMALDASAAVEEKRAIRAKVEDLIGNALDKASGKVPGEMKAAYLAEKRDYQALSIARAVAEDSAARYAKNASLGLTDKMIGTAVGTAGHVLGLPGVVTGPAAAYASKTLRQRGNAAAAVLLYRMANLGTITSAVRAVDDMVGKASRGLLAAPAKAPLEGIGPIHQRAATAARMASSYTANPQTFIDTVTRHTEPMAATSPELAGAVTKRMTDAMAFLASKLPTPPPPDPFTPQQTPRYTDAEARQVAAYHFYLEKPTRFFDELAAGKLTWEGAEVAKAMMPGAFAELQARTAEGLATLAAQGRKPPEVQRRKLGLLLDIPATPDLDPKHAIFLQVNVQGIVGPGNIPSAAPAPRRPLTTHTQPSTLDRLEAR